MNERQIIPLFPLGLVQFPGTLTPLHIFEQRYRQMLEDVQAGDKTFGIICRLANGLAEVGSLVHVALSRPLPDGRSNILCIGTTRFRLIRVIEDDETPYARAEVETFDDDPDFDGLEDQSAALRDLFVRLVAARRKVEGEEQADLKTESEDITDVADDPQLLSFFIAAYLDVDLTIKQRWLEMTLTAQRLREIERTLTGLVGEYEQKAYIKRISKTNGHGGNHHLN